MTNTEPAAPDTRPRCGAQYQSRDIEEGFPDYECTLPVGHYGPHVDGTCSWTDATTEIDPAKMVAYEAREEALRAAPAIPTGDSNVFGPGTEHGQHVPILEREAVITDEDVPLAPLTRVSHAETYYPSDDEIREGNAYRTAMLSGWRSAEALYKEQLVESAALLQEARREAETERTRWLYVHLCDALGIIPDDGAHHASWDAAVARVRALQQARDGWRLANEAAERLLPIANRAETAEAEVVALRADNERLRALLDALENPPPVSDREGAK